MLLYWTRAKMLNSATKAINFMYHTLGKERYQSMISILESEGK